MKRLALALTLVAALGPAAIAGSFGASQRGTTSAEFLTFPTSARAAGLGEAYGAVADDADALRWNPAALTRVEKNSLSVSHGTFLAQSHVDDITFAQRREGESFAAGVEYGAPGRISQTDENGLELGTLRPHDLALTVGYAFSLAGGASVGVAGKIVDSKILHTARTAAMDVGVLSRPYLASQLRFFATATNVGGKLTYDSVAEPLPFALRAGAAMRVTGRWLASCDLEFPRSDNPSAALGSEYALAQGPWSVLLRAGVNTRTFGSVDGFTGASFGLGVAHNGLRLDYAFLPLGPLDDGHHLSLTWAF